MVGQIVELVLPILIAAFWGAIAVGILIRFTRAKKGKRIRTATEPLVAAAESYQENLIGKTGMQNLNEASDLNQSK